MSNYNSNPYGNIQTNWSNNTVTLANGKSLAFNSANDMTAYLKQADTLSTMNIQQLRGNVTGSNTNMSAVANNLNSTNSQFKILNGFNGNDALMYNVQGMTADQLTAYKSKGFDVSGLKQGQNGMYSGVLSQDKTFMQKWGGAINTGLAAGGLALGVANYFQNKSMFSKQKDLMDEQIAASRENRAHLKEEWSRVDRIRKNVHTNYSSGKTSKVKVKLSDS